MKNGKKYAGKHESPSKGGNVPAVPPGRDHVAELRKKYSDDDHRARIFISLGISAVLIAVILGLSFDSLAVSLALASAPALGFLYKGIHLLPPKNLCRKCYEGTVETVSDRTYETGRHDTTVRRTVEDVTVKKDMHAFQQYTGIEYITRRNVFLPGYTVSYEREIVCRCSHCGDVTKDIRNYSRTYEY